MSHYRGFTVYTYLPFSLTSVDVVDDDSLQNQVDTALGRVGGGEVVGDYSPPHGTRVDPVGEVVMFCI